MARKGVSMRESRNPACMVCKCTPCAQEERCLRARGQAAYDARKTPPAAKPKKAKPALSKSKFIASLRAGNPSISDSQIKKAVKKAGYNTGLCGVVLLGLLAVPAGGIYGLVEVAQLVWG